MNNPENEADLALDTMAAEEKENFMKSILVPIIAEARHQYLLKNRKDMKDDMKASAYFDHLCDWFKATRPEYPPADPNGDKLHAAQVHVYYSLMTGAREYMKKKQWKPGQAAEANPKPKPKEKGKGKTSKQTSKAQRFSEEELKLFAKVVEKAEKGEIDPDEEVEMVRLICKKVPFLGQMYKWSTIIVPFSPAGDCDNRFYDLWNCLSLSKATSIELKPMKEANYGVPCFNMSFISSATWFESDRYTVTPENRPEHLRKKARSRINGTVLMNLLRLLTDVSFNVNAQRSNTPGSSSSSVAATTRKKRRTFLNQRMSAYAIETLCNSWEAFAQTYLRFKSLDQLLAPFLVCNLNKLELELVPEGKVLRGRPDLNLAVRVDTDDEEYREGVNIATVNIDGDHELQIIKQMNKLGGGNEAIAQWRNVVALFVEDFTTIQRNKELLCAKAAAWSKAPSFHECMIHMKENPDDEVPKRFQQLVESRTFSHLRSKRMSVHNIVPPSSRSSSVAVSSSGTRKRGDTGVAEGRIVKTKSRKKRGGGKGKGQDASSDLAPDEDAIMPDLDPSVNSRNEDDMDVVMLDDDDTRSEVSSTSPIQKQLVKSGDAGVGRGGRQAGRAEEKHTCDEDCDCSRLRENLRRYVKDFPIILRCSYPNFVEKLKTTAQNVWDLDGKVFADLILTDPPYTVRSRANRNNSNYDKFRDSDYKDFALLCKKILKPGGHIVMFCSIEQFPKWQEAFNGDEDMKKIFSVSPTPLVFVPSPNRHPKLIGTKRLVHTNILEYAFHAAKNPELTMSTREAAKLVNWDLHGYTNSTLPAFTNVIDGCTFTTAGETLFRNAKKNQGEHLRAEQKSLSIMQELVMRYSRKGGVVVDPFGGTMTTAVACMTVPGYRIFYGCDRDHTVVERGIERVEDAFVYYRKTSDTITQSYTLKTISDISESDLKATVATLFERGGFRHGPPRGLPSLNRTNEGYTELGVYSQCIPPSLLNYIVAQTSEPLFKHPEVVAASPDRYSNELLAKLKRLKVEDLMVQDLTRYNLYIGKWQGSTEPMVMSVKQISKGSIIGHSHGTWFLQATSADASKSCGIDWYSVTAKEYDKCALPVITGNAQVEIDGDPYQHFKHVAAKHSAFRYVKYCNLTEDSNAQAVIVSRSTYKLEEILQDKFITIKATQEIPAQYPIRLSKTVGQI